MTFDSVSAPPADTAHTRKQVRFKDDTMELEDHSSKSVSGSNSIKNAIKKLRSSSLKSIFLSSKSTPCTPRSRSLKLCTCDDPKCDRSVLFFVKNRRIMTTPMLFNTQQKQKNLTIAITPVVDNDDNEREISMQFTPSTDIATSPEYDEQYEEELGTIASDMFDIPDLAKAVKREQKEKEESKVVNDRIVATVASLKALAEFGFYPKAPLCSVEDLSKASRHSRAWSAMK